MAVTASRPLGQPVPTASEKALRRVVTADDALASIEHVLPLSGCRLSVLDLPDGSRVGQLYGPSGRFLDEARCERTATVSGWFGRSKAGPDAGGLTSGTSWALAFGAGGVHEPLEVRFASLRARRMATVVSDHYGLWVAEVVGSFRAATLMSNAASTTFRLRYAG